MAEIISQDNTYFLTPKDTVADRIKRDTLGRFAKGTIPFNRAGIKHTEETRAKLRETRKGKTPRKPIDMCGKQFHRWSVLKQSGKKGGQYTYLCQCECGKTKIVSGYNLRNGISKSCGCLHSEMLAEINSKKKGQLNPNWGKEGYFKNKKRPEQSIVMSKANNPNWQGGITPENKRARNNEELRTWRVTVFEQNKHTCQSCKQVGGTLQSHHVLNFSEHEDLRYVTSNGITLCYKCHKLFHKLYGVKNNNQQQIETFICQN